MKRIKYGRTDLMISEVCLRAGRIDRIKDRSQAYQMLDTFIDHGGNFIQASSLVGSLEAEGRPVVGESLLGGWMRDSPGNRERVVLSALIRCPKGVVGLELEGSIRLQVERVLKRNGTRYLDVALLDGSTGSFPTYEAMAAIERLSNAGLVRYVGSSGFPCCRVAEWLGRGSALSSKMHLESVHCDRGFGHGCLDDLIGEYRVSLVVAGPYPNECAQIAKMASDDFDKSSRQLGIAWLLARPSVSAVLLGPCCPSELEEALGATEIEMSSEDFERAWRMRPEFDLANIRVRKW